jgi:hypothetical protein
VKLARFVHAIPGSGSGRRKLGPEGGAAGRPLGNQTNILGMSPGSDFSGRVRAGLGFSDLPTASHSGRSGNPEISGWEIREKIISGSGK